MKSNRAALGLLGMLTFVGVGAGAGCTPAGTGSLPGTGGGAAGAVGVPGSGGAGTPVATGGTTGGTTGTTTGTGGMGGSGVSGGTGGSGSGGAVGTGGSSSTGGSTGTGGTAGAAPGGTGGRGGASTGTGGSGTGGAAGRGGSTASGGADAGTPVDAGMPDGAGDGANRDAATTDGSTTDGSASDLRVDAGATTCNLAGSAGAQTPVIFVVGDSTASIYGSDLFPRMGWAQPLQDFFAPACATVQDKALSGRSSKSFYDEGAFTPVRNALKAGDFVLIQFAHNDEKSDDPARFTDPSTTFKQYLTKYIDESQAKGAIPILLTPINRNKWSGATVTDSHGAYPPAMRQLAQARQIPLVDATALTKTYFERIGQAATTQLFMDLAPGQFPNYPDGNDDDTHLQEKGARTIGQMILADMARQGLAPGRLVKVVPQAP